MIDKVFFDITQYCNGECKYCFTNSIKIPQKYNEELTSEEIVDVLNNLYKVGIKKVSIGGGEPFLKDLDKIIVAYEPIWAIGTGKTATKEDANATIIQIRKKLAEIYGQNEAEGVIIQYGGSVKSSNAKELFEMSDIDGGLVGGASLKADEFSKIVNFAE